MRNRILILAGVVALVVAVLVGLGAWLGMPCGPSTCGLGGWLYDFQNLIAGFAALSAAGVAAFIPEMFRREHERSLQAQHGTRISFEIGFQAGHVSASLHRIRDDRKERAGVAYLVELPRLHSSIKQSRIMIESFGALLSGPDDMTTVRILWRVSSFRNAVENADRIADLFEKEATDLSVTIISEEGIDEVVTDLQKAGAAELTPEMKAAFLRDRANSLKAKKQDVDYS